MSKRDPLFWERGKKVHLVLEIKQTLKLLFSCRRETKMPQKGKRKGARRAVAAEKSRDVLYRDEDGQSYAIVTAMLGNGRLTARCEDTTERMCKIRGSMRRSEWISVGDIILVSLREFQDSKGDVLHRYPHEDVRRLRKMGELVAIKFADQIDDEDIVNMSEELILFEEDEDAMIDAL